jgi:tellurite resistance protein
MSLDAISAVSTAIQEAGTKIGTAARVIARGKDEANTWLHRFIHREIESRLLTRGPAYWEEVFPGLAPEERAARRIRRMLTRATVSGVVAAGGASTAEVLSLAANGTLAALAIPLSIVSVGAEMFYTTALRIDLVFDLACIYGVPFAADDVGEISTLLAMALGIDLVDEPTRHDQPATPGDTKPWRVARQMLRDDFAQEIGRGLLQQSVVRDAIPVVGVVVSVASNQIVLRRFARDVHTAIRQRLAIVRACRAVQFSDPRTARIVLDGAWLIATADGDLSHQEALALGILIDSLPLPARIATTEASFTDDDEDWFERLATLDASVHDTLMNVAVLVASADGELSTPERRFLRRLGRVLGRKLDLAAVERIVDRLRSGEAPQPTSDVHLTGALQAT